MNQRLLLKNADIGMNYEYLWKLNEFKSSNMERYVCVLCRFLYLFKAKMASRTVNVFVAKECMLRKGVEKSCEVFNMKLVENENVADVVFMYIRKVDGVRDVFNASESRVFVVLMGESEEYPDEMDSLQAFAISQAMSNMVENTEIGLVANFAIEYPTSKDVGEKQKYLALQYRMAKLDLQSVSTESWSVYGDRDAQDWYNLWTQVDSEEVLFWQQWHCRECNLYSSELKRCQKCKNCWYCSRDCQRSAWKNHRLECKAVAVEEEC